MLLILYPISKQVNSYARSSRTDSVKPFTGNPVLKTGNLKKLPDSDRLKSQNRFIFNRLHFLFHMHDNQTESFQPLRRSDAAACAIVPSIQIFPKGKNLLFICLILLYRIDID